LSVVDDGHGDATEVRSSPGRSRNLPDPVTSVAVALALAGLLTARLARHEIDLASGEVVLFASRPRRALLRYVLSLGLWELPRRSTRFVVTERRVIAAHGVLVRRTRSIPMRQVAAVEVVETPWERNVEITGGRVSMRLGPLDARSARRLTAAVTAVLARRR
jgi:membrane protein YdbS with pleckstrin-like domain